MADLPEEAVERLARVTKLLRTQRSLPAKLEAVVALAKQMTPGCDSAGITLLVEGEPTSAAVTDGVAVEIDLVQYQTGEGPCLAAMEEGSVIRIDFVERDYRFGRIAPGALALDLNSFLSIPLFVQDRVVGALNAYSHAPDAFDERSEEILRPMADYASQAISTSPLYAYSLDMVEGLVESLESQAVINRAAGVLIESERLDGEEAMDRLRELALGSGESLTTVSEWVLAERPTGRRGQDDLSLREES